MLPFTFLHLNMIDFSPIYIMLWTYLIFKGLSKCIANMTNDFKRVQKTYFHLIQCKAIIYICSIKFNYDLLRGWCKSRKILFNAHWYTKIRFFFLQGRQFYHSKWKSIALKSGTFLGHSVKRPHESSRYFTTMPRKEVGHDCWRVNPWDHNSLLKVFILFKGLVSLADTQTLQLFRNARLHHYTIHTFIQGGSSHRYSRSFRLDRFV